VIADLHAHYPMHLVPDGHGTPIDLITTARGRRRLSDRLRAVLVGLASRFANYRSFLSGPRVTIDGLRAGDVRLAFSVLYSFFDEVDLDESYGAPPERDYVDALERQLDTVEADVARHHTAEAAVAHNPAELQAALAAGKVALVHCVEGGFHLGGTPEEVDRAVTRLAASGVAYVILAHLFWRDVATNAPALPFLSDRLYHLVFPQPAVGLSELGRAAVRAMVRERVLIDVSHMSERALAETFALLEELDPRREVPLLASHVGFRFGRQEYNLSRETVLRIAERGGVMGLIFAQHQLLDGLRRSDTKTFEESFEVLCRHIDKIAELTGSHDHIGIGSDFDGFIKPTLGGLEAEADMAKLQPALAARYGAADAEAICSGNARRLLDTYWRGA
jgi:microsomal dipeptidase-like Zn-dependent dipeptidase